MGAATQIVYWHPIQRGTILLYQQVYARHHILNILKLTNKYHCKISVTGLRLTKSLSAVTPSVLAWSCNPTLLAQGRDVPRTARCKTYRPTNLFTNLVKSQNLNILSTTLTFVHKNTLVAPSYNCMIKIVDSHCKKRFHASIFSFGLESNDGKLLLS